MASTAESNSAASQSASPGNSGGQRDKQLYVRRCVPAEAARGEISRTYESCVTIRIVFRVEVRMDQKSAAIYFRDIVEYLEIADTRNDIFGQPTRDAGAFYNCIGHCCEEMAKSR